MTETSRLGDDFDSKFSPGDMRLLALVCPNNNDTKNAMKVFVLENKLVLQKFRLTGISSTMAMLREAFEDDSDVVYGPTCGDIQEIVTLAETGQLGGCAFIMDATPTTTSSTDTGISSLMRQCDIQNIVSMSTPSTTRLCLSTMRIALEVGRRDMIPSFFSS